MRVLILGATGMLGHKLWQLYSRRFDTWVTVRSAHTAHSRYGLFDTNRLIGNVDVNDFDSIVRALAISRAEVVINCIGVIKQLSSAHDPVICLTVNSLLPHRLASLCQAAGSRLIHISTDCVFSGRKGMYREHDISDAEDLYGRTKFLGEVSGANCLTLRTSIIGRELQTSSGLVEWFLSQREGKVRGYTHAIYSGFTTSALAEILGDVIEKWSHLQGVYHVSSTPISKYDLLCLLREAFNIQVDIEPYPNVQIDRSLDSTQFRSLCNFTPPEWMKMIQAMADDPTPYDQWRRVSDTL